MTLRALFTALLCSIGFLANAQDDIDRDKWDSKFFDNNYKKEYYAKTNSLYQINDTTVISDSLTFCFWKNLGGDTSYFSLFTEGIVSGEVFSDIADVQYSPSFVEVTDGELGTVTTSERISFYLKSYSKLDTIKSKKIYTFKVYSFSILQFSQTDKHRLRIKFKAQALGNPTYYYIEVENLSADKNRVSLSEFISNSTLTFILRGSTEI